MALSQGRHGVIVIHGISDGEKLGDILASVSNALADTLLESVPEAEQEGTRRTKIDLETNMRVDPPSVTLTITTPDDKQATWVCKEAYWADAFPPPTAPSVLRWLGSQIKGQLTYVWRGLFKDPANNEDFVPTEQRTIEKPLWTAHGFITLVYRIELLLVGVVLLPLSLVVPLVWFLLWPFYWLPRFGFLAQSLEWLHKIDPFLSRSLGDVKRYIEHGVWSASARKRLEDVVIDMLEGTYGKVDDVTIVAHSMGAVVTYDALGEDGSIAKVMGKLENNGQKRKKLTFISVGSGINQVFRMASRSNRYARTRFPRRLARQITGYNPEDEQDPQSLKEKFTWLDIYARFDPVPAGDLDESIICQAQVHKEQVKRRRVINLDNPMRDHSYYWRNKALVMPRIIRVINGGEYPWPEVGITEKKVKRHIRGVAFLVGLRILMSIIVVASLVASGLNLLGNLPLLPMPVPLFIALVAVGLYQSIRAWKFGDVS